MRKKIIKRLLILLAAVFLLLNVVSIFHAYKFTHFAGNGPRKHEYQYMATAEKLKMLFFGISNSRPANEAYPSQPYKTIHIKSNVELEAWSIQTDSAPKGTVILFHGYHADKSQLLDHSNELLKMGYNTLLLDFMGSGGSEGNSTTVGVKEAEEVRSCFDYVQANGESKIYLMGTSMGAVSVMKAMNDYHLPATAVLLECPFGSMYQTVCARFRFLGVPPFPSAGLLMFWGGLENGFWAFSHNPTEYAKSITCPMLLLWGEKDRNVSRSEIDEIFANTPGKKTLVTYPLSGHEDYLLKYKEKWVGDVGGFLREGIRGASSIR